MKLFAIVATALALSASTVCAQSGKVEVLWLGQAAFRISTPGGKVIVTDPWLLMNPLTPAKYKELGALGKVDVLLVTHAHLDHIADAPAIAKLNNIPLWGAADLNMTLNTLGVLPPAQLPRFQSDWSASWKVAAGSDGTRRQTRAISSSSPRRVPSVSNAASRSASYA